MGDCQRTETPAADHPSLRCIQRTTRQGKNGDAELRDSDDMLKTSFNVRRDSEYGPKTSSNVRRDSEDVPKTSSNVRRDSEDVPKTSATVHGEP
ncbi:unnamed protein product [Heligmosomoides polygyrus]|uniref:Uncharacterized protein n=1 Tax=Heligmosomoides polygyrus TaxID=6339 RepID=A0A183GSR5_HELPZ|nr:unnamed protein product [Heligmosomoides polygyrus]